MYRSWHICRFVAKNKSIDSLKSFNIIFWLKLNEIVFFVYIYCESLIYFVELIMHIRKKLVMKYSPITSRTFCTKKMRNLQKTLTFKNNFEVSCIRNFEPTFFFFLTISLGNFFSIQRKKSNQCEYTIHWTDLNEEPSCHSDYHTIFHF